MESKIDETGKKLFGEIAEWFRDSLFCLPAPRENLYCNKVNARDFHKRILEYLEN